MTEPTCLHPTRARTMSIAQGTPEAVTLWVERCCNCGTSFLYQRDQSIEVHPDGTQIVVPYDAETGDLHGGARGAESDTSNLRSDRDNVAALNATIARNGAGVPHNSDQDVQR